MQDTTQKTRVKTTMKLIIASDIHGNAGAMRQLMQRIEAEAPDKIILLGDILYHGPRNDLPQGYAPKEVIAMLNGIKERIIAVRGNCEAEVDQMVLEFPCMADCIWIETDGLRFFATHGHLLNMPGRLPKHDDAAVVMSGHTHVKVLEQRDGHIELNPGSVGIPKDGSASYASYENGTFTLRTLDGAEIKSLSL